jgi:hypothetical protein
MKLLVELFGNEAVASTIKSLKSEVPNMHSSYYIRNTARILSNL